MSTKQRAKVPKRESVREVGRKIRLLVMEMSARAKCGETGSSLCISDILAVLYFKILNVDPKKPKAPLRDRFILSKGHAAAGLYAALALRGFFSEKLLLGHRMNKGLLHAHPSHGAVPGIEASTGSLGHGLSIGAGMAEALKKTTSKVYVLLGNGECDEGSVWEAARYIGGKEMSNIVAIVDDNKWQGYPILRKRPNLSAEWRAAGWTVFSVDGHGVVALERALRSARRLKKPAVVIAKTIAGKNVPEIENTQSAHYYVPDEAAVLCMRKSL